MLEQEPTAVGAADTDGLAIATQVETALLRPSQFIGWAKARKPELALLLGMTAASILVSGAALAVLLSPNLGKTITYDPLIDEATLAAGARLSLGEQLLGKVARVLEVEIIETQGPGVGHRHRPVPAMVIVAQADQAAAMPEADLAVGLKAMVMAAGVGLGITGLMRLMPRLPLSNLGPRRRQPLSQRLTAAEIVDHPLAPVIAPTGVTEEARNGTNSPGTNGSARNVDLAQNIGPAQVETRRSQSTSFVPLSSLPLLSSPAAPAPTFRSTQPANHKALLPELSALTAPSQVSANPVSARLDFLNELDLRKQCHRT